MRLKNKRSVILTWNVAGDIVWKDDERIVNLTSELIDGEFEIVPKYIDWNEALLKYKHGQTVYYQYGLSINPIRFNQSEDKLYKPHKLTLNEIMSGYWFI